MNLMEANEQWRTRPADQRFETLAALRDAVYARRNRSAVQDVTLADMAVKVDDSGRLLVNGTTSPAEPTHWAFGQLAGLSRAPASYLRTLPTELAAKCLTVSIASAPRDAFRLMTLRDDDGGLDSAAAVTSTKYGRIWDADVVDSVGRIVERSGGRFFNPKDWSGKPSGLYASDHDCFVFMIDGGSMVDGGGERDQLHRGFIVWNSEVGAATFGLMCFLFRVVCGNHIIWDAQDVTKLVVRHTGGGPARFDREAMPALLDYVNASVQPIEEKIRRAKALPISTLHDNGQVLGDPWLASFAKQYGFTRGEVRDAINFAKAEEGQCGSVWDLVNGFTASARRLAFMDARIDLERRAGKLLEIANR